MSNPRLACHTERMRRKTRTRLAIAIAVIAAAAVVALPTYAVADYMLTQGIGATTKVIEPDGSERTVYWREYPGVASLDADDVLDGPSVDEAYATATTMLGEMRSALTDEFALQWVPDPNEGDGNGPFFDGIENRFGGQSLLTTINSPTSQSTSVPTSWAEKQRAIEIIGDIAANYGFGAPVLDYARDTSATEDELIRDWGGATPETMVIVSGSLEGPTGQWLSFSLQDLSKDVDGRIAERIAPASDSELCEHLLRRQRPPSR